MENNFAKTTAFKEKKILLDITKSTNNKVLLP